MPRTFPREFREWSGPGLVDTLFGRWLDFFEEQLCDVDGMTGGTLARGWIEA